MYEINKLKDSIEIVIGTGVLRKDNRKIVYVNNVMYQSLLNYYKALVDKKTKNIEGMIRTRLKREIPGIPLDAYSDIIYIIMNNGELEVNEVPDERTIIEEPENVTETEEEVTEETFPEESEEKVEESVEAPAEISEPESKPDPEPEPKPERKNSRTKSRSKPSRSRKKATNKTKSS